MKADAISTLLNSGYTRSEIDKLVTL